MNASVNPYRLRRQRLLYNVMHGSHQYPTKLDYKVESYRHHLDLTKKQNAKISSYNIRAYGIGRRTVFFFFIMTCCPEGSVLCPETPNDMKSIINSDRRHAIDWLKLLISCNVRHK